MESVGFGTQEKAKTLGLHLFTTSGWQEQSLFQSFWQKGLELILLSATSYLTAQPQYLPLHEQAHVLTAEMTLKLLW